MLHFLFKKLSYSLLKLAFSVHNLLGPGLLESAYEGAFCVELAKAGISCERQIVQYRITDCPSKAFVMNQLRGFSEDHAGEKIYLIHDNDPAFIYIDYESLGIKNIKISIEAPNMNPFAERFVGSIKREALDWFVIFTESQLEKIVKKYIFYYNNYRMHQGIKGVPCGYNPQGKGKVISMPLVFGLHHHYYRKAS